MKALRDESLRKANGYEVIRIQTKTKFQKSKVKNEMRIIFRYD